MSSLRDRGRVARSSVYALRSFVLLTALAACSVYTPGMLDSGPAEPASQGSGANHLDGGTNAVPAESKAGSTGAGGAGGSAAENLAGTGQGAVPATGGADSDDGGSSGAVAGGSGAPSSMAGTGGGVSAAGGSAGAAMAGNGGSSATSGAGGSSGAPSPTPSVIDDFEDDDLNLLRDDQRTGSWFRYDDGSSGTTGPSPLVAAALTGAPAALGKYAIHITATGFSSWGSGLAATFMSSGKAYDASRFSGVRFWARVGQGKEPKSHLQISDATTEAAGGKCNSASGAPASQLCGNHFGSMVTVTTAWAAYEVRFDAMSQAAGWGLTAPELDAAHVYGIQFVTPAMSDLDLWLDQLEFF